MIRATKRRIELLFSHPQRTILFKTHICNFQVLHVMSNVKFINCLFPRKVTLKASAHNNTWAIACQEIGMY